jgi:hypothetical protein
MRAYLLTKIVTQDHSKMETWKAFLENRTLKNNREKIA